MHIPYARPLRADPAPGARVAALRPRVAARRPGLVPGLRVILSLALLLTAVGLSSPLQGQDIERERQEALLPELGIVEIDPELRERLGLFAEVQDFRRARLFLRYGVAPILEIESVRDGRLERERRLLSDADLSALRADLEERFAAAQVPSPERRPLQGQEARGSLVLGHTLLGLGYHGWAVPVALDIDSAQGAVAAYLLTAGASFYLPYRLTRDRPATRIHRDLSMYGGTRGIGAGLLVGDALADPDGSSPERIRLAAGVLGGWAGTVAGYAVAGRAAPDDGTAALWAAMGDAGFAAGALTAFVAGPYDRETVEVRDGEFVYEEDRVRNRALGHAITLTGGASGLAAGRWLGPRYPMTEGNVTVLRSAGILGAQLGVAAGRLATEEDRALAGALLAGGVGSTALALPLLERRRFTEGEGLLVAAGHLAGGATALGITYLIVEDVSDRAATYLATSAVGSLLGAGLVARALDPGSAAVPSRQLGAPGSPDRSQAGPDRSRTGVPAPRAGAGRISLELHPSALLSDVLVRRFHTSDREALDPRWEASSVLRPPTLLTLRF